MFLGEYAHTLDTKGRLTIPARLRGEVEGGLVLTRGYDPCIVVYAPGEFSKLSSRIAQMPATSQTARSYARLIFGGAFESTPDKLGRVVLPSLLREHAGIQQEAIIVGCNTYMEIWSPERWQEAVSRDGGNLNEILADLARLGA